MDFIRTILAALFIAGVACCPLSAQVVLNDYARVVDLTVVNCRATITLDSTASFSAADPVFIIQTIGCTSQANYDVAAVGRCEFNTIRAVSGRTIELAYPLVNAYDTCGIIQLIRVPTVANTTISQPITGQAWDGRVGGVIVIDVRGTLTIGADITADGLGFRGGITWPGGGDCSVLVDDDVAGSRVAAAKGETYVSPLPSMVAGGRALFTGGGGGRGHNSGGGGGGNGGSGGRGGSQWQGCGSYFDNGGRPGDSAAVQSAVQADGLPTPRMGGGGGAGHMNNNSGTPGAHGGGIVVIRCDTLVGSQGTISANGLAPDRVGGNDGAGGGGAGGTIHIEAQAVIGTIRLSARGGAGGNMNNGGLHGPGGGGGGGVVACSPQALPPTISIDVQGGPNGRNVAIADPQGSNYMAEGGLPGVITRARTIPQETRVPVIPTVRAMADTTVCQNDTLVLDCDVSDDTDSVRWYDPRGRVVGTTPRVELPVVYTDTLFVHAYGAGGCFTMDSVIITVRPPWDIQFDTLDLGTIRCDRTIDTTVIVRNLGRSTASLRSISDSLSVARWVSGLPDSLRGGDSATAQIRVIPDGRQGAGSAVLRVHISPCDTIVTGIVRWFRSDRTITLAPDTVVMPAVEICSAESSSREIDLILTGADVVVEAILTDSVVSASLRPPVIARSGQPLPTVVTWSPTRSRTVGQLGLVVRDSACRDTLWMTVLGAVRAPYLIAPDVVQADTLILCQDSTVVVHIPVIADTATPWIIDSVECVGPGYTASTRGDTLRGVDTVVVVAAPSAVGSYEITLRMRLLPCDTVVTLRIQGTAVDAAIEGTPEIVFTEPVIGREQTLSATYTNRGSTSLRISAASTPTAPFRIVQIQPALPTMLRPGDSITIDLAYQQTFGAWADSIVLECRTPCPIRVVTQLRGTGSAVTRVRIPDVRGSVGQTVDVPILIEGRPTIDPALLDVFDVRFSWKSSEAHLLSGTDGQASWTEASWTMEQTNDSTRIHLQARWDGSDTLVSVPLLLLLSDAESTDLVFDRTQGFVWFGQQSTVEYDDGLLVIDDVCSGRLRRSIRIGTPFQPVVAPLPAGETLIISVPDAGGAVSVSILNLQGELLLQQECTAAEQNPCTINVLSVPAGRYIARISSTAGSVDVPVIIHR